ncbi:F510_1955 family glycosylhydrolase [Leucobacter sp. W1478]|uniref:F510_1955 family glycosylhydrolase n=1 Tax=Leucobacter sp. W1478 TaxID=3439065 RepID=UPI003F38190A
MKPIIGLSLLASLSLALTACTTGAEPSVASAPPVIEHVHGVAQDPRSDNLLVASHNGLFSLTQDGIVAGPIGGYDFDAMGFAVSEETLFASGHPGLETPSELGSPNLGIIRSDNGGESWDAVALTGEEDFHVLTAGPGGVLYGIGSSSPNVVVSTDGGATWSPRGIVAAADLAVTDAGLYATTEEGLQLSTDQGSNFVIVDDAPVLYLLTVTSAGTLIGAGVDGYLWLQSGDGSWEQTESLPGPIQALGVTRSDHPVLVDDRGIVEVTEQGSTVRSPASSW